MKTILVTGASTGIGLATAEQFSRKGWQVFATVRKQADLDKLNALGISGLTPVLMDVNDKASIIALKQQLEANLENGLDAMVNNAALSLACPLEYASDDHIRSHFETNVIGTLITTREFIPLLKKARGRIINISSGAGKLATPLMTIYSATKFAIEGASDVLRVELRKTGVKTIVVEPGFINTPIHDKLDVNNAGLQDMLGEKGWAYYKTAIGKNETLSKKLRKSAPGPDLVAQVIEKAIDSKNPKARYTAGKDARLMALLEPILSDRLKDKIWFGVFGL